MALYAVDFLGKIELISASDLEHARQQARRDVREAFGRTNYEAFQMGGTGGQVKSHLD